MTRPELMTDREHAYLLAKEGPVYVAWEVADRWLKRFHEDHPGDDRDDLELLTTVFSLEPDPITN